MSKMIIHVEFLPGTDVRDAIEEAKEKAAQLDVVYVAFKFNEASFSIGRNADIEAAIKEYKLVPIRKYIVQA